MDCGCKARKDSQEREIVAGITEAIAQATEAG